MAVVADARRFADMHALYRFYDEAGKLLYVGITGNLAKRLNDHEVKRWYPLIKNIGVEWFPHEAAARVAERRAISSERPRYNIAGTPLERKRTTRTAVKKEPDAAAPGAGILADVLEIFGDAPGLPWQEIAERTARRFPDRWDGLSRDAVSAHCRALGVPSVQVKFKYRCLMGCRRTAVEEAATQLFLDRGSR